jgi:hypothetical protein
MARGLIFWIIMLVWFVFFMLSNFGGAQLGSYAHGVVVTSNVLDFVLFLLLGWQVYGPPVHG